MEKPNGSFGDEEYRELFRLYVDEASFEGLAEDGPPLRFPEIYSTRPKGSEEQNGPVPSLVFLTLNYLQGGAVGSNQIFSAKAFDTIPEEDPLLFVPELVHGLETLTENSYLPPELINWTCNKDFVCPRPHHCPHCKATVTTMWRKIDGIKHCNRCALYQRLHGRPRPLNKAEGPIKRRSRSKKDK